MVDDASLRERGEPEFSLSERPTVAAEPLAATLAGLSLDALKAVKRYEQRGLLGEGGMGEVRLCVDHHIGREVAMKVIRKDAPAGPEVRARFFHEARVQGQTEHPSIVPVYDLGTNELGEPYFTMRRVEGKTIEEIVRSLHAATAADEREYSRHKLLNAFGNACLAVHFAHTRKVFHCDLKPANIMLGAFGEVYVLDWGLATFVAPSNADTSRPNGGPPSVSGTPGYMAPEQIRGEALDARTDVYALGAILYEILTLSPMHEGKDGAALMRATLRGEVERPSARAPEREIPPELDSICVRATQVIESRRYSSARDLYDDLERYLAGDRDFSMRCAMSREQSSRAASLAARVAEGGPLGTSARSDALRAVGRALALDPDNPDALRTLVALLLDPPREIPAAAAEDMRARERAMDRVRSRAGAIAILAFAVLMPCVCLKSGVRSGWMLALTVGVALLAAVASIVRIRRPRADGYAPTYVVLAIAVGVASWGLFFSPQLLTPAFAVALAGGFTTSMDRRRRFLPMIATGIALVAPFVLEELHVLAPSQVMQGTLLCELPRMSLFPDPSSAVPTIVNVGCLVAACFFGLRFREVLTAMQRRVAITAWQLQQLLPKEAGAATAIAPVRED